MQNQPLGVVGDLSVRDARFLRRGEVEGGVGTKENALGADLIDGELDQPRDHRVGRRRRAGSVQR